MIGFEPKGGEPDSSWTYERRTSTISDLLATNFIHLGPMSHELYCQFWAYEQRTRSILLINDELDSSSRALRCITAPCHFAVNVSDDASNGKEHDVQSHMFRPTITDMQDKFCGNCYDICIIQSPYKGNHKRGGAAEGRATSFMVSFVSALNQVNIVAITTILVLHVGNSRAQHV